VYTQCPDCATVFRITAEALRAAAGDVRCGVCSTTFNALENLSELAFKAEAPAEEPSPDDSMTVEELPGGENIELSAPAELAAVPEPDAPAPVPSPDPSPAPSPTADEADSEARAMEFHGDAADLDRLFVVENPAPVDIDSTDEHPILVLDERDEDVGESIVLETVEPPPQPPPPPQPMPAKPPPMPAKPPPMPAKPPPMPAKPPPQASSGPGHTAPRILVPDEMRKRLAAEAAARVAAAREFESDEGEPPEPALLPQRWPWVAGVAVLALLLLAQIVHAERNDLVRSPTFGPLLAGAYSFLGLSPLAPTDLEAYELRQWGAATDPRAADRLMLRASIVNRAGYAQPFPLLRLTLQDRFGGTLAERDIGPGDYLPGTGAAGLLEPGQRADALIRIVDPGAEAVGFELDVCLPAKGGVRCANQIKTASQ
jgi:predicted Zn finger-like uncharacterized protein